MKTLPDLNADYVNHLRSIRYSAATQSKTRWVLRRFAAWLAGQYAVETVDRLLPEHLRQWHAHITTRLTAAGHPLSPWAVNSHITAVRGWLQYLAKHGHLNAALREWVPLVKKPRMLPGSVLTHAQMRKLLAAVPTHTAEGYRNRAMLETLYTSGIRVGELLGLDLRDVDLPTATAKVKGKGGHERIVPLGRTARRYLESYLVAVRPFMLRARAEPALFLNQHGRRLRYSMFLRAIRGHLQHAGLDVHVTPHTFRRSCTTELIRNGANLYHVKELLGHASLDTLKHYAKLTINDLKRTHEKCHPRERDDRRP